VKEKPVMHMMHEMQCLIVFIFKELTILFAKYIITIVTILIDQKISFIYIIGKITLSTILETIYKKYKRKGD
jgi:hypothetical protein